MLLTYHPSLSLLASSPLTYISGKGIKLETIMIAKVIQRTAAAADNLATSFPYSNYSNVPKVPESTGQSLAA